MFVLNVKEVYCKSRLNSCNCEIKAWNTSVVLYKLNLGNKPTRSSSFSWFVIRKDEIEIMNVLKSYIRTAGEEYKHKEDHCSFRCSFGACIFFRLSFNNCRSCICNWNDLLTLHCLHCPLQTSKF